MLYRLKDLGKERVTMEENMNLFRLRIYVL